MKAKIWTKEDFRIRQAKQNMINVVTCSYHAEVDEFGAEELFPLDEFCRIFISPKRKREVQS